MPRSRPARRPSSASALANPASRRQVVKAKRLRDVVAGVPFQCGFVPEHSVVILSLRGPRRRVGLVTRADLPDPSDAQSMAEQLSAYVQDDDGSAALVLVYDDLTWSPEDRPHQLIVDTVLAELAARSVRVLDALFVSPTRFWSYTCTDPRCCPPEGHPVAEAMSSPVAAAYVMAGLAPLASRTALVERLRPNRPLLLQATTESTWRWLAALAAAGSDPAELRQQSAAALAVFAEELEAYRWGPAEISVEHAGQLLASLQEVSIRDEVLLRFCRAGLPGLRDQTGHGSPAQPVGPAMGQVDSDDVEAVLAGEHAVERLLVDLCIRLDGPLSCAPLTILGWHSWARGEGALARVAVERALLADPTYRLATLLLTALDHAVAPEWVTRMRAEDSEAG
jgi:Domain of unknown function (DUF4192)